MIARLMCYLIAIALAPLYACVDPGHAERRLEVFGTTADVEIHGTSVRVAERVSDDIVAALTTVDGSLSNWRDDSGVARLNREARIAPVVIEDHELYRCIKLAREYARRTGGAFDPTVGPLTRLYGVRPPADHEPGPGSVAAALEHVGWEKLEVIDEMRAVRFLDPDMEVDLGGLARGHAVDVGARNFAVVGITAGRVRVGGTVYGWGTPPGDTPWSVELPGPGKAGGVLGRVWLADRAVSVTSAADGIFDPATGMPAATDVLLAAVVADSAVEADALGTAFYGAGSLRTGEILGRTRRVEAILVVEGARGPSMLVSTSLKGRLEVDPAWVERFEGRVRYILPPGRL